MELKKRLRELDRLGVTSLEFVGEKRVFSVPVLGKGCVGIVILAYRGGEKVAVKLRRVDADRFLMRHEAEMLKFANTVKVGPQLLGVSKNFILMQFIDGLLLPKWLEKTAEEAHVKAVLVDILKQCWRLDRAGLDHGELSHAPKHVIVDFQHQPFIVDFESASLNRRSANVTSIVQFLFVSGAVAEKVAERLGEKDRSAIIEALRSYKADLSIENFKRVLTACGFHVT